MSQRAEQRRMARATMKYKCRSTKATGRMNPNRAKLLRTISGNMAKYFEDHVLGTPFRDYLTTKMEAMDAAKAANFEWMSRSRGKGGRKMPHGKTYIKSVALAGVR